jgi:formylglycine-generating enzyme required for sulfatase activity
MPWAWPAEVTYHEAKAFGAWQAHRDGLLPDSSAAYRMLTEAEHHCLRDESQPDRVLWCPGEHFADPHASSGTATAAAHASGDVPSNADAVYEKVLAASPGGGSGGGGAANSNLAFGSCSPVDALEPSRSGHYDVAGNAWQWTEDHFHPLPGFAAHAFYDDFSTPCFDGRHHMIMGGSYASSGDLASVPPRLSARALSASALSQTIINPSPHDSHVQSQLSRTTNESPLIIALVFRFLVPYN